MRFFAFQQQLVRARTAQDSFRYRVDWLISSIIWHLMTIQISVPLTRTLIASGSKHPRLPKLLALHAFQRGMLHESRPDFLDIKWPTSLKGTAADVAYCRENSRITVGFKRGTNWVQHRFKCIQALMWQTRENVLMALSQFKHLTKLTKHD